MAFELPVVYRKSSEVGFNVDYIDTITNLGYKKMYCCGGEDSTGSIYFLTTDATIPASQNNRTISATNTSTEANFDITFNNTATIAGADAYVSFSLAINASASVAVTIYHVNSAGTETSLGTKTSPSRSGGVNNYRESMKIALTKRTFTKGDKLRVEVILTDSDANASNVYIVPAALATLTESVSGRTINTDFFILFPFEIGL